MDPTQPTSPTPPVPPQPSSQPPVTPPVQSAAPAADDPGHALGVTGFILAFFVPIVGLILSIIARRKSKKAGLPNSLASAGIVIGSLFTAIWLIIGVIIVVGFAGILQKCADLGPGVHYEGNVTYTCN